MRVPECACRFLTCARSLTWPTSLTYPLYRIRPECSVDFSAEQKLYGVLFVPISCCIGVFLANVLTVLISVSRIHRKMINTCPPNMIVHITGGVRTLLHCLFSSSFGIHLKRDTIAQHGPLYYALNPRLFERASWDVGLTRTRFQRRNQESGGDESKKRAAYPQAWLLLRSFFEVSGIDHDFINDTMTLKKSASGALSVLVLSYVGVIETALPILDCFQSTQSDGTSKYFLRSDRNIECSSQSAQYRSLVAMAAIGLAVYGVAIPALFQLVVWSKWGCRFYRLEFSAFHVSSPPPHPPLTHVMFALIGPLSGHIWVLHNQVQKKIHPLGNPCLFQKNSANCHPAILRQLPCAADYFAVHIREYI